MSPTTDTRLWLRPAALSMSRQRKKPAARPALEQAGKGLHSASPKSVSGEEQGSLDVGEVLGKGRDKDVAKDTGKGKDTANVNAKDKAKAKVKDRLHNYSVNKTGPISHGPCLVEKAAPTDNAPNSTTAMQASPQRDQAPYKAHLYQGCLRPKDPSQDGRPCSKKIRLDPLEDAGATKAPEKKKVHRAGRTHRERLALGYTVKEFQRLLVLRSTTYMQAQGPNAFSIEGDGLVTSTGWQGRFLPKDAKDKILKA
ncbi:hypothetical protein BDN72DRAFT_861878 [Pluteus cervinus]|uniref:Uncharacterized protein n=1 Tax=Pluteus cervinus TaxID=181527 RepID=A0ACD3ADP6_9AGAR|nr:hypothetical protein BDN72DRAFT_861878 [Pluteus cervinus]